MKGIITKIPIGKILMQIIRRIEILKLVENNTYENNNRRSYNNSNNRERQDYYRNNQGNGNYENKQVRWEDRQTQGNYGDQRKTYAQINNSNIERQNDSKNLARASEMNKIEVVPQMHN